MFVVLGLGTLLCSFGCGLFYCACLLVTCYLSVGFVVGHFVTLSWLLGVTLICCFAWVTLACGD